MEDLQIGDRIRFFRISQNILQDELASGIISVSYLSKIENNQVLPSIEVIDLLCKRLGIKFIDYEQPTLKQNLFDWYRLLIDKEKDKAKEIFITLEDEMKQTQDSIQLMYYMLFKLRYHLMLMEIDKAREYIEKINELIDIFTDDMKYYYYKFMGLYQYLLENYQEAFDYYKRAEKIIFSIVFEKWEEADLFYALALTSSRLWKVPICINYAQQALDIYQANYNYRRSSECQILLGISYQRIGEFEKSETSFKLANKIANTLGDNRLKGLVEHNLGCLMSVQKRPVEAIEHFINSLNYHDNMYLNSKLNAIYELVKEYYFMKEYEQGLKWIDNGLELVVKDNGYHEYELHFKVYQFLMREESEGYENYMKENVLPYFEEKEKFDYLADYAEFLGVYYEKMNKYKFAAKYYAISNGALRNLIH